MGRSTSGKHPVAKDGWISKFATPEPCCNHQHLHPPPQKKNKSTRVIFIMGLGCNCYFGVCVRNYRCTSCCRASRHLRGGMRCSCLHKLLIQEKPGCFFFLLPAMSMAVIAACSSGGFDWDVWRIGRWTVFTRGIYSPCVLAPHVSSGVRAHRVPVVNSLTQIHANAAASAPQPYINKHAKRRRRTLFFPPHALEEMISYWQPVRFGCQCFPHGNHPELIIS